MPALDATECQRAVNHFEALTNREIARDGETIYDSIRSADIGGPLLLAYELAGPAGGLGISAFRKDVQNAYAAYDDWTDGNRFRRRGGFFVNVLNTANHPVSRGTLYALADDEEATYDIDDSLAQLERAEVLFATDTDETFRTPHETWSALYLERLLADRGEHPGIALFEVCVTALFGLVDTPEQREQVRRWVRADSSALNRIEAGPKTLPIDSSGRWPESGGSIHRWPRCSGRVTTLASPYPKRAPRLPGSNGSTIVA
jgi:hypothetical protein